MLRGQDIVAASVIKKTRPIQLPDGKTGAMHVVVPVDEGSFSSVYHVNPVSGGTFDLSGQGAWVSQAYRDHTGAKVGDVITVDGSDGTRHQVPILGFYEFWLTYFEMVMGPDYYQKEFGDAPANAVLVQNGATEVNEVAEALSQVEGFSTISDDAASQRVNFNTFSKVSAAVVAIYLGLAALMSVVVLLNLNVMFIDEKKRELIVLMINGFSVKDAKHYISYDSVVLTALGIVAGLVLGSVMGSMTVAAVEPSTSTLMKGVDPVAVLVGTVGSAVLALIMSRIALRRIPKFNLTDINKA